MNLILQRLRSRRLASTFILLAAVSAAVWSDPLPLTASAARKAERAATDATPLKVVNYGRRRPTTSCSIAKAVGPAVVNINTQTLPKQSDNHGRRNFHQFRAAAQPAEPRRRRSGQRSASGPGRQLPGLLQPLLRRPDSRRPMTATTAAGVQESLGSGFIVDPKGYIITNNHVIDKADKIYVKLSTDPDNAGPRPSGSRHRRRQGHRPRRHQDRDQHAAADRQDGQLRHVAGGRLGGGHRQPVCARADRHRRHHLRQEPHHRAGRATASSSTSSRPTRPSIPATPAARC